MITDLRIAQAISRCYEEPHFKKNGVESRIESAGNGKCQIVATRGTTNLADWIKNLRAFPIPVWGLGWVHPGFYVGAWRSFDALAEKLDITKPVYFGGHSKGGPESILYSYFAARAGFKVVRAATFGAPEFISKGGAEQLFHLSIVQYRNGGDLVPLLPSKIIKFIGHTRPLVHIGDLYAPTGWKNYHNIDFYIKELDR